ncbi:MAG TPA: CapA family protein [Candidatus Dormibacteraeota bacterium]|nr:CapA family protein [Candidatus Dormibacteraeota bacterium]
MTLNLRLVGDINLKRDLGFSAEVAFSAVRSELESADLRLGNLEGCFSDPTVELPYKRGWFHCEPEMALHLRGLVDAVACANNVHFGPDIVESLRRLDDLGIRHSGAGCNRAEARQPVVIERSGVHVGLLAYTSVFTPVGHAATEDGPGVATIRARAAFEPHPRHVEMPGVAPIVRSWPDPAELDAACQDVRSLRERVDVLVVYCHWGVTGMVRPAEYQRTIGRALVDAGAHVVAGSHPHRAQGVERYGAGVIFYSLGNFVFGWGLHRESTRDGLLARLTLENGKLDRVTLVPVARDAEGRTQLLSPQHGHGRELADSVITLSADLDTEIRVAGDELLL